ncbi:phage tail protein [Magnetospirillum aberrantis]|uniref:Phage tail protein n=1 Tax=Magnetospirillum aberrantis SpK TaxID=908842 RepID=A0A7C9UZH4_9PROT|nr:phage tail protein [Magnetospirillum aberrantis]NFV80354.1 phage tail protein [Magnetospirillum aberrantis SpK]
MAQSLSDPYRGFRFRVEIAGIQIAAFSEASIPDITIESVDYREGTDPIYKRPLSGLSTYGRVTLRRGLTDSTDLYEWQQQVLNKGSTTTRKNISLILIAADGQDKCRWNIINAWPTKYETGGLNASSSDVVVETLEIALDYMTRVK